MLPLADTHVHLLAGLDDGPRDQEEAIALCKKLVADGVRTATALAHQNPQFAANTPDAIMQACHALCTELKAKNIPLTVYPTGEVVLTDDLVERWKNNELQSVAGAGKYLLVEMPHRLFLDPRPTATALRRLGIRMIVAHAERYESMLHDPDFTSQCIAAGCLIQVTAEAFTESTDRDTSALREWAMRGMIHILGTDGHRIDFRQPKMRPGYRTLQRWIGEAAAERIGSIWGGAVLQGLNVNPPPPKLRQKKWFDRLFGR